MSESASAPRGRFCWHELMTTDPDAAPAFYGAVVGWGTQPWEDGPEPYTMWTNGETPLGGLLQLPEDVQKMGAPPNWLAHVAVPDVAATTARAKELGAKTLVEMEVPQVGLFAVLQDPQGAVISAYQPAGDAPGHDGPSTVGEFSWHELATDDWEAAWSFYSELFGWQKAEAVDLGEMGTYQMFTNGAHPIGGFFDRPPQMPVSAWLHYVRVSDVNAAVSTLKDHGGQVLNGPMEVPGGDLVAQCMDPQGAAFALHSTKQG